MGLEITSVDVAAAWIVLVVVLLVVTVIAAFAVEALAELGPQTRPAPRPLRPGTVPAPAWPGWVAQPPGPGAQTPGSGIGASARRGACEHGSRSPVADDTADLDPVGAEIDTWGWDEPGWQHWREVCGQ